MTLSPLHDPAGLGPRLRARFGRAEAARREVEERWLADLRLYKGVYDPEVAGRLHPRRSRAFLRLTRAKVKAVTARLMDLLFPGSGEANWLIEPTPLPELPGLPDGSGEAAEAAATACAAMTREMRDQLAEIRYREVMRDVVHSGNLYGTGVLKGPLVSVRRRAAWERGPAGWRLAEREELRPYVEHVPLWDIYPDMGARDLSEARYVFQRHLMTPSELQALAERPDFDGTAIREHLRGRPGGDATDRPDRPHEAGLSALGNAAGATRRADGRYEVIEFWGYLPAGELAAFAPGAADGDAEGYAALLELGGDPRREVPATAWLLGDAVVKAVPSPVEGVTLPYYFYYFDKDETSIFGEGLAQVMRDPQQLFNASVRALLDNAAIAAGPQIEVNQDLLPESEDVTDVHPFRIWLRSGAGAEAQSPALRVYSMESHTQEFLLMADLFARLGHEVTGVPSALATEFDRGAGQTARGLSMLLSQAALSLREQVRHFDDGVTRPFITALYHWNMRFSPRPGIRGDFEVKARGVTGLAARETYVDQLDAFAASVTNPLDAPWIKRGELLRRRAMARDLGEEVVRSEEEMRREISREDAARRNA